MSYDLYDTCEGSHKTLSAIMRPYDRPQDKTAGEEAGGGHSPAMKQLEVLRNKRFSSMRLLLSKLLQSVHVRLKRQGVLNFDELLSETKNLLENSETTRQKIAESMDQLLVDEVQDTDPIQYDILRSLVFDTDYPPRLFVVGDPKQTIYGFRNADLLVHSLEAAKSSSCPWIWAQTGNRNRRSF